MELPLNSEFRSYILIFWNFDDILFGNVLYPTGAKLATKRVSVEKQWNIQSDQGREQAGKLTFCTKSMF